MMNEPRDILYFQFFLTISTCGFIIWQRAKATIEFTFSVYNNWKYILRPCLITALLPVMCFVKGLPLAICHPKEAASFSYLSVWFVLLHTLWDPVLYHSSVFFGHDFELGGLYLPSAAIVGGVSFSHLILAESRSHTLCYTKWWDIQETLFYKIFESRSPRVYYITSWGPQFLKTMSALCFAQQRWATETG